MRIVLDSNVLVSALVTKGTPPDQLYQAWLRNEIELVTCAAQIDELADVLSRPKLRKYVDRADAAQLVADIHLRAIVVRDMPTPRRSPDPKDDAILAAPSRRGRGPRRPGARAPSPYPLALAAPANTRGQEAGAHAVSTSITARLRPTVSTSSSSGSATYAAPCLSHGP